ncbi:hypothetical protein FSS13T_16210 [Flavobacterium saliperosum S13]|uniref:Guanylate cyclase domain-containing protein n=1 Tax=Flavobacterium saliperosum S13 TaxID=1341155 RepID=A0ABP3A230_9FLAO|nr:hypothetical protein FSS13T_16210 [Flavobacterium saliperosum S13]
MILPEVVIWSEWLGIYQESMFPFSVVFLDLTGFKNLSGLKMPLQPGLQEKP